MPSTSNSSWAETVLISLTCAAISSYIVLQITKEDKRKEERYHSNPYNDTLLHNSRTIISESESDTEAQLGRRGWSMADAMKAAKEGSAKMKEKSPGEVLLSLQKGNSRFWTGKANMHEVSAYDRRVLINQQFPATAILGCSDSRVPVEIVFDQGLGDMFVVRVAGNCLGHNTEGSLEYAVHHLNVKVLLVMGHEGCGAVRAARLPLDKINGEASNLAFVLKHIKDGLDENLICQVADPRARDREAVTANVRNQIKLLAKDEQIMAKVNEGNLIIVGAFYEISSGIVDFFTQISKEDRGSPFVPSPGVLSRYNPKTDEVITA